MLIPHSAKGLRLLDQPDHIPEQDVVPEDGDRRVDVGKLGRDVNEKLGMEAALSERSKSWHET
jgi:hypothetical protein